MPLGKRKKGQIPTEQLIKKPMGQPRTVLDENVITEMASEDCTVGEIASRLGASRDTIYVNYSAALQKGRDFGNASLKRKMFEIAMSGNVPMLIWLSKQRLGYREGAQLDVQQNNFQVFI